MEDTLKTCHFYQFKPTESPKLVFDDNMIINDFFKNMTSTFLQEYINLWNHPDLKLLILTHTDADGHGSGALLYKANKTDHLRTHLYNVDYSFDFSSIEDKIKDADLIFITDLSLGQEQISYIEEHAGRKVIWIDHHESSKSIKIKDPNKMYSFIHAEIGVSATLMVWIFLVFTTTIQEWLFGGELDKGGGIPEITADDVKIEDIKRYDVLYNYLPVRGYSITIQVPDIIRLISLYDTFDDSMDIRLTYGISYYDFNINSDAGKAFWNNMLGDIRHNMYEKCTGDNWKLKELLDKGGIIKQYVDNDYARIRKKQLYTFEVELRIKHGTSIKSETHTVAAMNVNGFSMAFGGVIEDVDACIRYFQKADGTYEYGIYSSKIRPTAINCMQFASAFGGGGHLHAAGWTSKTNDVYQMARHYKAAKRPTIVNIKISD